MPGHYHWPTDTPDRVDYETVAQAAELCRAAIDRLASSRAPTLAGERVPVH